MVYQNDKSMKILILTIVLPVIPLYAMLVLAFLIEITEILIIASILYLTIWIIAFIIILCNVNEVMAISKDQVRFINPYSEKVLPIRNIRTIYYNEKRGFSFRMGDNSEKKFMFRFDFDKPLLEDHFRRISNFIDFSEEHIHESSIYCLVNNKI
jgi:hypothetical protein